MLLLLGMLAIFGGMIAAIAGFGIGSLLTPVLATWYPARLAVAAVSIPHLVATGYRFWLQREHVDWRVLRSFGLMSAVGGLAGAVVQIWLRSRALELVLATLLLFVGTGTLLGLMKKLRFAGIWAWTAGAASGFLGGLVGNQGGLRAGAMLGLGVSRDAFIATATATGLIVDVARMPVYLTTRWVDLVAIWPALTAMVLGVLVGTMIGTKILKRIPESVFNRVVALLLIVLGVWLLLK